MANRLKSSYDNFIFAADVFFDQCDPSTATLLEELCKLQGRYVLKKIS